ncbi:hypothetical protein Trydic_g6307 [Trypoxylus dichotomus]
MMTMTKEKDENNFYEMGIGNRSLKHHTDLWIVERAAEEEIADFYLILQIELDEAREEDATTIVMGDGNSREDKDQTKGMGCMG